MFHERLPVTLRPLGLQGVAPGSRELPSPLPRHITALTTIDPSSVGLASKRCGKPPRYGGFAEERPWQSASGGLPSTLEGRPRQARTARAASVNLSRMHPTILM